VITQNNNPRIPERNGSDSGSTAAAVSDTVVETIWRGRWIVLFSMVALVTAAVIYIMNATPTYTSTSRIYVEQSGPRIVGETEEGLMTQSKNYLYTQAALLRSTPILTAAMKKPGVQDFRVFFGKTDAMAVAYMKKAGLNISVGQQDDIISVSSDSPNPAEAAQLVNAVVDAYITYQGATKQTTSDKVLEILHADKKEQGEELTVRLQAMADFKRKNESLAFESTQGNVILQRLAQLSTMLTSAQALTIDAKTHLDSIQSMTTNAEQLRQFLEAQRQGGYPYAATQERAVLKARLESLQIRLADRRRQVQDDHPAITALLPEIKAIELQITEMDAQFVQGHLSLAREEYRVAQEKEADINRHFEEQRKQVLELNEQQAEYTVLQLQYEQTRKHCDILDERIKELSITENVGALNISILEVAQKVDKPSKPEKTKILAAALMMGLMMGGGLAVLRSFLDQRLRSAEEISAVLGVPTLGVVPTMSRKQTVATRGRTVHMDSTSPVAEAYRTIRTAIFFSVPKGQARTLLVTSPAAGDGKSTLVSNLCIAMAQAGQKVLVIDADFRKPMQHAIFEMTREPGVSSIMAGTHTIDQAVRPTDVPGLDILPCGPDVPNPSEMLNSEEFANMMSKLATRYDRVVVDAPPVIPVTDACILGAICDVTLLVLRAEKSTRKTAQQARDGLNSVGARILGAVVNDVNRGKGRYGYYYGYGSYGYGQAKDKDKGKKKLIAVSS